MTALAPHLTAFLQGHLPHERRASPHTCEAYADSFRLLVCFAAARLRTTPSRLEIEQLDPPLLLAFLEHIEEARQRGAHPQCPPCRHSLVLPFPGIPAPVLSRPGTPGSSDPDEEGR
jgi:hypothetical protein